MVLTSSAIGHVTASFADFDDTVTFSRVKPIDRCVTLGERGGGRGGLKEAIRYSE